MIQRIFIYQGLSLCILGIAIGILSGVIIALNVNELSLIVETLMNVKIFPEDIYYLDNIPVAINHRSVFMISIFSLIISFIGSYYPSHKASKLDPVEVLQGE